MKKRKQLAGLCMMLVLVAGFLFTDTKTVLAEELEAIPESPCSGNHEGWIPISAVDANGTIVLEDGKNYYLTNDLTTTSTITVGAGTYTLCLNGHSITANHSNTVLSQNSGVSTLNLCDCRKQGVIGHTDTTKSVDTACGVNGSGGLATLNIFDVVIKNNYYGVSHIYQFYMYSGALSNNELAIYCAGTTKLYNGTITGNKGVVYAAGHNFYMYGGTITGNEGDTTEDAFDMNSGEILLAGGSIENNAFSTLIDLASCTTARLTGTIITNNTCKYGIEVNNTTLEASGGSITENTILDGTYYSAVFLSDYGILNIIGDGVKIVNNTVSDTVTADINLFSFSSSVLVSSELTEATKLNISSVYGSSTNIIAKPDGTNVTSLAEYKEFITYESNISGTCVSVDPDGNLVKIDYPPYISKQPTAKNLTVEVDRSDTINYQWYQVDANGNETAISGETGSSLQNYTIGNTYLCKITCDYQIVLVTDEVTPAYHISTQPTASNPTVETNDTQATYQWYEAVEGQEVITDQTAGIETDFSNLSGAEYYNGISYSSYKDNVWTPCMIVSGEGSFGYYFCLKLEPGDTVTLTLGAEPSMAQAYAEYNETGIVGNISGNVVTFTVTQPGIYGFAALFENISSTDFAQMNATATMNGLILDTKLSGETNATLQNATFGKSYVCKVTFADGSTEVSNAITYTPAIISQPTASNPTVVTNDDNTSFQWYEAVEGLVEITDQTKGVSTDIAAFFGVSELDLNSTYVNDAWIPAASPYGVEVYYFVIELEEGNELTINFKEVPTSVTYYGMIDYKTGEVSFSDTTATFTAPEADTYCFSAAFDIESTDFTATATMNGLVPDTELSGETSATLSKREHGKSYACVVNFSDNTAATSYAITIGEEHTGNGSVCDICGEDMYATFRGSNLTLDGTIHLNFFFELDDVVLNDGEAYVRISPADGRIIEIPVKNGNLDTQTVPDTTLYVFTCDMYAKQMADEVTVQVISSLGEGKEYSYSITKYAETILSDTANATYTAETQALVQAMLNYGAYAQVYFNYNTANPANAGYEDTALTVDTTELRSYVPNVAFSTNDGAANYTSANGITYVGSSLLLESQIMVRHYFDVGENTAHGLTDKTEGGYYYVDTAVNIADMEVDKSVTVDDYTVTYCPLDYISTVLLSNADGEIQAEKLRNLMKALYLYYTLANTYPN